MTQARVRPSLRGLFSAIIPSLFLALLFTGCGTNSNGTNNAPTVSITANPTSVEAGGSSTLTVTAAKATSVTVSGSDGSSFTLPATGGTKSVTPSATTTYTATAAGAGGSTSATATVSVTAKPTVSITANPATIAAGATSTLTVTATNATTVTVTGSDGSSYTLAAAGGTQAVTPAATTTYTATATGAGGKITATAVVTVAGAPTVTITANPTSIVAGSSSILTVTATNATTVTVTGTDSSSYTLTATGGVQAVTPAATVTYTATAVGPAGTVTATAVVTVTPNPPPTVTIVANPTSITSGSSSTLTVTAVNATTVTVTGTDGSSYPMGATGGLQAVTPAATTTYTATAVGPGGTITATAVVTVTPVPNPSVTISANPTSIVTGNSSTLTVVANNAPGGVIVTGTDNSSYTLTVTGGTQTVTPTATTSYTATATGATGTTPATASTTVTVTATAGVQSIDHVIFMLQENHSFDDYFGMLNPYRAANGWNVDPTGAQSFNYTVDGIDDKLTTISNQDDAGDVYPLFPLTSTCIDDDSSAWLASYGDVNRYNFLGPPTPRPINMDGFVHTAEGYATSCKDSNSCSGSFTDLNGERAMGYYLATSTTIPNFLNYYYYMASQFAISDRWFSPVSSKSIDNRIATFSGGTTQGLVNDPGGDDHLGQLPLPSIFAELDTAKVSWKIYYTVTQGFCLDEDDCPTTGNSRYPATDFSNFSYSLNYIEDMPASGVCPAPMQESSLPPVNDSTNSFCIDINHIAPLSQYYADLTAGTLPSFAFIEAGYGENDEHPGSGQTVLHGQAEMAQVINALMATSTSTANNYWSDSVFFFSYDEGGGPYDHVPPVPGSSNINTDATSPDGKPFAANIPDIGTIAVNPDTTTQQPALYFPCPAPSTGATTHCDLTSGEPGYDPSAGDAPTEQGFAAQLGFRLPNIVISPFSIPHYVAHTPMDHTAVIKFVENLFIGSNAHLTNRDAAQPDLLEFFNFNTPPWATPPTPPTPYTDGGSSCTPSKFGQP